MLIPVWVAAFPTGSVALSVLTLSATGFLILMAHPRLYWGEAGNDLHAGAARTSDQPELSARRLGALDAIFPGLHGPGERESDIPYLQRERLGARACTSSPPGCLVLPGLGYLLMGIADGHFRAHIWPGARMLTPRLLWRDAMDHARLKIPPATRRSAIWAAPAVRVLGRRVRGGAADGAHRSHGRRRHGGIPWLLRVFRVDHQSARTIHFVVFAALAAVRARPCGHGRQVGVPPSYPGDDDRGVR